MDGSIDVGIVGLGAIGRTHADAIRAVAGARVVAVAGSRPGSSASPRSDDVVRYDGIDDLLERGGVDVVAICSPPAAHAEQARRAIAAGKHVVIEKSPTETRAQLTELMRLAEQHGVCICVVSQQRLLPHSQHLARLLHSGRLGRPLLGEVRLHWHRPQSYYDAAPWRAEDPHGGSLPNQGWHAVDLLRWFYGPVAEVGAVTATLAHRIEVEDTTSATVRFRSGALGSIVTTTAMTEGEPSTLALFTDRASITVRDGTIERWDVPEGIPDPPPNSLTGSGASDPALIGIEGHRQFWCDVVDALRSGRAPSITAADGAATVELIEAIYESARTGRFVTLS